MGPARRGVEPAPERGGLDHDLGAAGVAALVVVDLDDAERVIGKVTLQDEGMAGAILVGDLVDDQSHHAAGGLELHALAEAELVQQFEPIGALDDVHTLGHSVLLAWVRSSHVLGLGIRL